MKTRTSTFPLAAAMTLTCLVAAMMPMRAAAQSAIATAAPAQAPQNALEIEVVGLRNDNGQVGCSLFNDPSAYPRNGDKVLQHIWAPIHNEKALCSFLGLKPGPYAAVVYHDENKNGKFDQNAFGMPEEGYGFTNDAAALFSPPSFGAASIVYTGAPLYTVVHIRY